MQTASRCQPASSLLFLRNKGRETCSGDLFTSRTISSYIMTQVWLPANCCSEPRKTIRSPRRAASAHNAGFVPPRHQRGMCEQARLICRLWRKRWQRERKSPWSWRGSTHTSVGAPAPGQESPPRAGGRRRWSPSASAFLSWQQRDDGKSVVAPQGRDGSDPSAENALGSFGVWLPVLPGVLTDLGSR